MKAKYFLSGLFFAMGALMITSCDSDREDNPILDTSNMTSEFVLNTPAYAEQLTDLATSSNVNFTWSQPNYGMTLATVYAFQLSVDGTFTDAVFDEEGNEITPASYVDLSGSFQTVSGSLSASAINRAIIALENWEEESQVPASMLVYFRCKATLADNSIPAVYSNVVKINVVPSFKVTSSYEEFVYAIGDDSGWATVHPLRSAVEDDIFNGVYTGFAYLNAEFKFRSHEDSWDAPDWGAGSEDGKLEAQAGNLIVPAPGFYKMEMSLVDLTYSLTPINTIGVVGPAQEGGWNDDTDMTYNPETGAWEVEMDLAADELKFRANDDWAINWGGDINDLTQDGPNIAIDAAGKYKIQLYITYEGAHKVVFTKL
ncbi:MAG: SusE domain-containing protein [Prevotella sp.]|nr:SusE domain-containing protein [Prevotella sp.]